MGPYLPLFKEGSKGLPWSFVRRWWEVSIGGINMGDQNGLDFLVEQPEKGWPQKGGHPLWRLLRVDA